MARLSLADTEVGRRHLPPRAVRLRVVGLAALAPFLLIGCGTPAGGDPGGKRLKELSHDLVFAAVPRGATIVKLTRTPARYRKPGFEGGGWDGPGVSLMFKSSAPPADVYRFYDRRAGAAGSRATPSGALGLSDRRAKTSPGGATASLSLR